jgi:hypothetical protein
MTNRLAPPLLAAVAGLALTGAVWAQSSGGSSSSGGSASGGASSTGSSVGGKGGSVGSTSSPVGGAGNGAPATTAPGGTIGGAGGQSAIGATPGTTATGSPAPGTSDPSLAPGSAAATQGALSPNSPGLPAAGPAPVNPQNPGGSSSTATNGNIAAPNGSGLPGGISGSPAEAAQRQADPRCNEVLAHKDFFTANVVQACQNQQVGGAASTASGTEQRNETTGSLGTGVRPVDRPSEVQKNREPSDNKAVNGICTNCK